ncbi:MAG: large repetitive protein [Pseudobdellovibrio sp.]|nr:large repetitive protein [Pseudobdellovibrio sp.]
MKKGFFKTYIKTVAPVLMAFLTACTGSSDGVAPGGVVTPTNNVPAPTITSPASSPFASSSSSIVISGTCVAGYTVTIGGDLVAGDVTSPSGVLSQACSGGGTYSFTVAKGSDATYNFNVLQSDASLNNSSAVTMSWVRNSSAPSAPTITSPASNPNYSNSNSVTISGACTSGLTVTLGGNVVAGDVTNPFGSLTTTCASSAYSFTFSKFSDSSYNITVMQTSLTGVNSATTGHTWVRDTAVPNAPTILNPASSNYTSAGNLTISGGCETGATVNLTGDDTQSVTCASSAYSFTVIKSSDATYNFGVTQTDVAGNASGSTAQQWTRNSSLPPTPTITVPATTPFYSNLNSVTISGGCVTGYTVTIGGNLVAGDVSSPAGSLTQTCSGSAYSFTVDKSSDSTYNFTIKQTNLSAVDSANASQQWVRDTVAPSAPTITTPAASPYYSTGNLTIAGACVSGFTVNLTGSDTQSMTCASNAYSFTVNKSSDATYNFAVTQTDLASNASSATNQQWIRDNSAPSAPTITLPVADPHYSNGNSVVISGACVTGLTVTLGGNVVASDVTNPASSLTRVCSGSAYSFTIAKSSDSTYNFNVKQTSLAGVDSSTATRSWIRDTVAPSAPTITSPASSPSTSGGNLTLSGACETNATVNLTGDDSQSTTCLASAYSFTIVESSDATYNYSVTQTDQAGNTSGSSSHQWNRVSAQTAPPVITVPASSPYLSNGNNVTISGTCIAGATVNLAGASSSSMTCTVGNTFSFSPAQSTDGSYNYSVTQTVSSNTSTAVFMTWNRDTAAPLTPTVTSPAENPFTSGDSSFDISGTCEANSTLNITGATSATQTCTALGTFTKTVSATTNATYTYNFSSTDAAGNTSGSLAFVWNRDNTIPATPTITAPSETPYYRNGNSVTISGGCATGNIVTISGDLVFAEVTSTLSITADITTGNPTVTCNAGAYNFTVAKSVDATYNFNIFQTNASEISSAPATQVWVRDTVAPSAPTITNPNANPYTASGNLMIAGACETSATVNLAGSDIQSTTCSAGTYSFTVVKASDATYNFTVSQTDRATNASGSTAQQWIRDSTVPPTPTILSPSTNPYRSNTNTLTLSGGCQTGLTVTMSGNVTSGEVTSPAGSLTQTCTNSSYSFTLSKGSNGTFTLSVKQTNAGIDSGTASVQWIFDNVAPLTTIQTNPTDPNLYVAATFSFTVDDATATSECKIDAGAYAPCVSPVTYTGLTNASHTFSVRSTDVAGNVEAVPATYTWVQNAGNTVALYHLNGGSVLTDSGSYSGANALTFSNATSQTGRFSEGAGLAAASNQYLGVSHTASMATMTSKMTVEAFVRFSNVPGSNGAAMIIASKMGASGQYGWEFGVRRQGGPSNQYLYFSGSLTPTGVPVIVKSSKLTASDISALTAGFNHLAVTWNAGTVRFYMGGVLKGSGTIGTAGTAVLNNNTGAGFRIGTNATGGSYLDGVIDEVRLSQIARWSATFTAPSSEYTPD